MEIKELDQETSDRQKRFKKIRTDLGLRQTTPKLSNSKKSIQEIIKEINQK